MLGISCDAVAENRAFAAKFQFPFPLLCDSDRTVSLAYQTVAKPTDSHPKRHTYVIDAEGRIAHAFDTKDPAGQAQALLELLG